MILNFKPTGSPDGAVQFFQLGSHRAMIYCCISYDTLFMHRVSLYSSGITSEHFF